MENVIFVSGLKGLGYALSNELCLGIECISNVFSIIKLI